MKHNQFEEFMNKKYDEIEVAKFDVNKIIALAKQRKVEEEARKPINRIKRFFKSVFKNKSEE